MPTNYPGALDTSANLKNDSNDSTVTTVTHAAEHNDIADAVIAIEAELGANPSGSYATVAAAILNAPTSAPGANQTFQATGNFIPLILRAFAGQTVNLQEWRSSGGTTVAHMTVAGLLNASSLSVGGSPLASTHLSDSAAIARLAGPAFTGNPTAPTAATADDDTSIATTAFVKAQGYATLVSPALVGNPTAPTASVDDSSAKIATT